MKTLAAIFALVTVTIAPPTAEAAWEVTSERSYETDKVTASVRTTAQVLRKGSGGNQSYDLVLPFCRQTPAIIWPSEKNVNLDSAYSEGEGLYRGAWIRFDKNPAVKMMVWGPQVGIAILWKVGESVEAVERTRSHIIEQVKKSNTLTMGLPYWSEVVLRFDLTGSAKAIAEAEALCE